MIFDKLGKKTTLKIIKFFLTKPTSEFYEKEIERSTKVTRMSVRRAISELLSENFLIKAKKGKLNIYSLNTYSPVAKKLKVLFVVDMLYSELKNVGDAQIFLYGSSATGEYNEKSDIDVLVISKRRDIIAKIKKIDPKVNVSFYTPMEWSKVARKDRAFFESVEANKIRLV